MAAAKNVGMGASVGRKNGSLLWGVGGFWGTLAGSGKGLSSRRSDEVVGGIVSAGEVVSLKRTVMERKLSENYFDLQFY